LIYFIRTWYGTAISLLGGLGFATLARERKIVHRAVIGLLQALAGAYVGIVLLFIVLAIVNINSLDERSSGTQWAVESVDFFKVSAAGMMACSWWVIPVGTFFGAYLRPKFRHWQKQSAALRGALLGAGLGLATAIIFKIIADQAPTRTIVVSFAVVPVYCGAWCALVASRVAAKVPQHSVADD
jgi:hypothetical protein